MPKKKKVKKVQKPKIELIKMKDGTTLLKENGKSRVVTREESIATAKKHNLKLQYE